MAPKVTIGLRVDPDSIEPYKEIYGKLTEGQKIVYETWLPLREAALRLLKNKFSTIEICSLINVTKELGFRPEIFLNKSFFLYEISGKTYLFKLISNEEAILGILTKLKDLHELELFFLFEYCHAFKFSTKSIKEYAKEIANENS